MPKRHDTAHAFALSAKGRYSLKTFDDTMMPSDNIAIDQDFYQRYEITNAFDIAEKNSDYYIANDQVSNQQVLLRVYHPDIIMKGFEQKARQLSQLRIPHLAHIIDYGITENEQIFYTTPFFKGLSISELLSYDISPECLIQIISQILDSVRLLHLHGLIHLNLKPENILVSLQDVQIQVVIVDPGIPSSLPTPSASTLLQPPELINNLTSMMGPATDIYMVAAILCHALRKIGHEIKSFSAECFPWRNHLSEYPAQTKNALLKVLQTALHPHPYKRYMSVDEFQNKLSEIPKQIHDFSRDKSIILQSQSDLSAPLPKRKSTFNGHLDTVFSSQSWSAVPDKPSHSLSNSNPFAGTQEINESLSVAPQPPSAQVHTTQRHPAPQRREEYERLSKIAENALKGNGTLCIVSGGFGYGKTRLLRIFTEHKVRNHFSVITCSNLLPEIPDTALNYPQLLSLQLILSIFIKLSSQIYTDNHVSFSLKSSLQEDGLWNDEDEKVYDELAFLSKQITQSPFLIKRDDSRWRRVFPLVLKLIQEAACLTPLCIAMDDIQRCTLPIFQFLLLLNQAAQNLPLLILASYDPYELGVHHEGQDIIEFHEFDPLFEHEVHLAPLEPETIIQMLKTTWHIDESLGRRVAEKSYGNPYYAVSLVQYLGQLSRLKKNKAGLFTLSGHDERPIGIPSHLSNVFQNKLAIITEQIGSKSEIYLDVLCRISVLGTQTTLQELEAFWDYEGDKLLKENWREAISAWCELNLLTMMKKMPSETESNAIIDFVDPFHAEILQNLIPPSKRRMLKEQAALALIECYDKPTYVQAWRIASNWKEAQNLTTFIQYCSQSCELAMDEGKLKFGYKCATELMSILEEELKNDEPAPDVLYALDWGAFIIKTIHLEILLDEDKAFDPSCELLKSWGEQVNLPTVTTHIQRLTALRHLRQDNLERTCETAIIARDNYLIANQELNAHQAQTILAIAEMRLGEIQEARRHFEESLPILKSHHAYTETAWIQYYLSQIEWFACHFDKAKILINDTLSLLKENHNRRLLDQIKMFDVFMKYIKTLDRLSLYAMTSLYETIAEQADNKARANAEVLLLIAQFIHENWEFVHDTSKRYAQIQKLNIHDGIVSGTLSCLKAIEQAFNGDVSGAYNEITMSIAFFGPKNRRARAWCHLLLGGTSILQRQYEQGTGSFERALSDFDDLNDEIGRLCVLIGRCALATSCKRLDEARGYAKQISRQMNDTPITLFNMISSAITDHIEETQESPIGTPIDAVQDSLLDDEDEIADLKRMVDE